MIWFKADKVKRKDKLFLAVEVITIFRRKLLSSLH